MVLCDTHIIFVYFETQNTMDCFICNIISGNLVLKEHEDAKWLTREMIDSVEWLPADLGLIDKIREDYLCPSTTENH